jgi:hypothetical protein
MRGVVKSNVSGDRVRCVEGAREEGIARGGGQAARDGLVDDKRTRGGCR